MSIREDLVASAVQFLQDGAVQQAPLAKRVAFLESKNMTASEIDAAMRRAANPSPSPSLPPQGSYPRQQRQSQEAPPLPNRDWRDWFIMAVVTGGVTYGVYTLAKVIFLLNFA